MKVVKHKLLGQDKIGFLKNNISLFGTPNGETLNCSV